MNIKRLLKLIVRKSAILFRHPSHMNVEAARTILESFSSDPATTCIANNTLDIQYDLQIIVPAYNVEKYVEKCLESVLNQKTEYSYLVTIVNDGSTDRTLEIIKLYQEKYSNRMEVIDQPNRGLSGARNSAMKVLKGRYITFLDSDDVLADGAVDILLNAAQDGDSLIDIVQGSWYDGVALTRKDMQYNIREAKELSGFPWGKLFRAEVLKHFQFPEGYLFEDTPISFILYGKNYRFKTISDVVYGYRINPEGITAKSKKMKRSVESYYITALCLKEFPAFNVSYDKRAYEYFLNQCCMNFKRTLNQPRNVREAIFVLEANLKERYFKDMYSKSNKEIESALDNKQFRKFEILAISR